MNIRYLTDRQSGGEQALRRRGLELGWIRVEGRPAMPDLNSVKSAWRNSESIFLPSMLTDSLPRYESDIAQAEWLMERILEGSGLSELLESGIYAERLSAHFHLSGSSLEDHDDQGIEKAIFDAWQDDDIVAENLWCKASWLSFEEDDASLRFRFSFGFEGYENVAADPKRQTLAAELADAVFPESFAVTQHARLKEFLSEIMECENPGFTERIVYFNAPNGGAQMHHDVERGHEGVVFAQMSGSTFWLALSKPRLLDEISLFLDSTTPGEWTTLRKLAANPRNLADYLEAFDHDLAEELIDRNGAFFGHLIERGYAHVLLPGDVLLLPQFCLETAVWHSVICLGDKTGEGLSFALKKQ